jgi:rhodanese-related sulfurtransferase
MAVQKIDIDNFIIETSASIGSSLRSSITIDVRSPAEFEHAHIPHALIKNKAGKRLSRWVYRFLETRCSQ